MISLSANDATRVALEALDATPLGLVTIRFPASGTVRLTDAPRDLVVGGETYSAHLGLAGVSPLAPERGTDRALLQLQFLDPDPGAASWYHRFTHDGHTGISMDLAAVFEGDTGALSLPFSVYAGHCVAVKLVWGGDNGRMVAVRFAGPFGRRSGNRQVATDAAQRRRRSTDRSLRYIAVTRNIQWGRKVPKGWEDPHPGEGPA